MKSRITIAIGALSLFATACGGGGGGGVQDEVADEMIKAAAEEGITVDESCVKDIASKLSDADAQAILEAEESGGAPEVSDEAEALSAELVNCIDSGDLIDDAIASLPQDGSIDLDCVREIFEGLDFAEMEDSSAMGEAAAKCVKGGG